MMHRRLHAVVVTRLTQTGRFRTAARPASSSSKASLALWFLRSVRADIRSSLPGCEARGSDTRFGELDGEEPGQDDRPADDELSGEGLVQEEPPQDRRRNWLERQEHPAADRP